jgi:restriction endonuclease S subunit
MNSSFNIKLEQNDDSNENENYENKEELFNSDLIEDLSSNEKILNDISKFISIKRENLNKKNLINYCGILDPNSETESCARINSIFVAKFGKSHIKSIYFIFYFFFFFLNFPKQRNKNNESLWSTFTNVSHRIG